MFVLQRTQICISKRTSFVFLLNPAASSYKLFLKTTFIPPIKNFSSTTGVMFLMDLGWLLLDILFLAPIWSDYILSQLSAMVIA